MGKVVVIFGTATPLWAEPSITVRRLMKEPVSAFDWGLVRMENDLQEDLKSIGFDRNKQFQPSKVYVRYESKINSIQIAIFSYPKQTILKVVPAKDICKNVTNYVRRFLVTGSPKHMRNHMGITRFFTTSSFTASSDESLDGLEAITRIKVNVGESKTDQFPPTKTLSECDSPLLGEAIFQKDS